MDSVDGTRDCANSRDRRPASLVGVALLQQVAHAPCPIACATCSRGRLPACPVLLVVALLPVDGILRVRPLLVVGLCVGRPVQFIVDSAPLVGVLRPATDGPCVIACYSPHLCNVDHVTTN
ncbi:hypothetical protein PHYPSEUDO_003929 [Phytophthora pseudosyringae]|uniref:Uncharacterized protein n=1 Tax=Phytophthora pseudosyringae TaxID=221518 RepID=A0A8T1V4U4_9STRA|nr:hypothetical protein PHYPSEUDO_003929 [Phytophthora pseudosyringae]